MDREINILRLNTKESLKAHFYGIAELFLKSFCKPLDGSLWEWAYIDNPYGNPLVSVAMDLDRVVGHYAVVPFNLINKEGGRLLGYLSMTTMVDPDYRRFKLFKTLADDVFHQIESLDVPAVVFGFPNDNSSPGFREKLGWTVNDDYRVVTVPNQDLGEVKKYLSQVAESGVYTIDFSQKQFENWRCKKPSQEWNVLNGVGAKAFSDGQDLMYVDDIKKIEDLAEKKPVNLIMPITAKDLELEQWSELFEYRFGYRSFNCDIEPSFFVQMCMSDIF